MPAPVIQLFENDSDALGNGTPITAGNPVAFGLCPKGQTSTPTEDEKFPIHLWNDQTGAAAADTAENIVVSIVAADDDNDIPLFNGTTLNGNQSMIEARSNGSLNTPDDAQTTWTPIGPANSLAVGNMPSNSRRSIELRIRVPLDSPDQAIKALKLVVNHT